MTNIPIRMSNSGYNLLRNPWKNKGSFTNHEKEELLLNGLLPLGEPESLKVKGEIAMTQLRTKVTNVEKLNYLLTIKDSDETLFHSMLAMNLTETLPLFDTPVMGSVCLQWSHLHRQSSSPRGLYIGLNDTERIESILHNYPNKNIKVIVLTDGENISGFGDLGANAMGIPIGKLALYTTCAGVHPDQVLPVTIDVGTDNKSLSSDPVYIGIRQKRDRSENYDKLVQEFVSVARNTYGRNVLLHFEGFSEHNADRYQNKFQNDTTLIFGNKGLSEYETRPITLFESNS
jgi:malic enzyme